MSIRTIARRAALAGATVAAVLALAGCSGGDDHRAGSGHQTPATGGASADASTAAEFGDADVLFAQMMIPHHEQAVQMSELAATRAQDAEVKRLAAQIKAAQAPEIATMTAWLTAWGRPVPSGSPAHGHGSEAEHDMPGMMSDEDMAELAAASGAEFDRRFVTMMIEHHEGAITMAEDEIAKGKNPEVKALAQQIRTTQRAEIDTMRKLLARR
ncbi:DUF305 domain-containing protein [Micromonospora sp. KC213]|uniref:DUF305 domain-containing protein n=1 Tax=Micromonospora sp. KC213 TaxID=2530378 RepID=UPI001FB69162|nr:DUF305 domain-containing protein [Micromonospora sp. KC213]